MAQLNDIEIEDYLYLCVSIDRSDINSEFCRVASDMAYWGEVLAQTEAALGSADIEQERVTSELDVFFRAQLSAGSGKVTEKMVQCAVTKSSKYLEAAKHANTCKSTKRRIIGILDSIKTKRDMLVSLGAQLRAEQQHDPRVLDHRRNNT